MTASLRIAVWPGMPDEAGLAEAGRRIGRELDVSVISSNEDLEDLMADGPPFDLVTPSDYLVEKLVTAGRLADLSAVDLERDRLAEWSRHPAHDPEERFSVPLAFGTTGYLYATARASGHRSWRDLFDPPDGIEVGVLGELREVIGAALVLAGHSPNATGDVALADAERILWGRRPAIVSISSDDFTGPVESGAVAIHQAWSGPASMAVRRTPGLGYSVPSEGALLWVTTAAIPADAPDPEGAGRLLRELMDPEIASLAVVNGGYSTPNDRARELLPKDLRDDEALFPSPEIIDRCLTLKSLTADEEDRLTGVWQRFLDAQPVPRRDRAVDSRT